MVPFESRQELNITAMVRVVSLDSLDMVRGVSTSGSRRRPTGDVGDW